MKKFGSHLLVLLFAMPSVVIFAQTTERPKPGFTLSIEEGDLSHLGNYPTHDHVLLVTYTNISEVDDIHPRMDSEDMLNMIVLRNGAPAEETDGMRALRKEREDFASGRAVPNSLQKPRPLKPGECIKFPLEISGYFDMTKPGTYTITVNRETFPWETEKSVTVWSNTITIVVPKPKADKPK
jgi:hypothetical protein